MPSGPLCRFLLQLQPPATKKRCVCSARLLLLQRQTVPQAAPSWGHHAHLWHKGTTNVPNLGQVLCWGGKAFPHLSLGYSLLPPPTVYSTPQADLPGIHFGIQVYLLTKPSMASKDLHQETKTPSFTIQQPLRVWQGLFPRTHLLLLGTPKGIPCDSQSPGMILIPKDSSCPSASEVAPHQTHSPDKRPLL